MYYDAAGRLIRTESADGSCSRVEFSPWHAAGFDANDTIGEPGNAWYSRHVAASATAEDKRAAALALVHYKTPSLTMLDSLGREVIAIAHNRVADANGIYQAGGKKYRDERYLTFTRLDTESKPLWIRDAKGNLVMQYLWPLKPDRDVPRVARDFSPSGNPNNDIGARVPTYDIAGNLLFKHSMDAGNRWMIDDAAGKLLFAWDFNQRQQADDSFVDEQRMYSMDYDALHRPTAIWLRVNADAAKMIERFEYQDAQTGDANNLNGQRVLHYDASGRTETVRYDFQGTVLETRRRLNNQPTASLIDWSANPDAALESESFTQITQFDALQRLTLQFNWHRAAAGSPVARYLPTYNQRGLLLSQQLTTRLEKTAMDIRIGPDTDTKTVIKAIRYDAKGQKTYRILGNGTITRYDYDSKTFRLRQLRTTRLTAGQIDPSFADFACSSCSTPTIPSATSPRFTMRRTSRCFFRISKSSRIAAMSTTRCIA
jgi:YD repeat-containing protein